MIDLHIHTTASDGTDAPETVVKIALEKGLTAIAVTDHDTAAGVDAAVKAGQECGVEVVPGIEISAEYEGTEVHILGYFIDPASPELKPVLDWVVNDRDSRNEKIIQKLADDGYDISLELLRKRHPNTVLGRPHIAERLLEKGYVTSIQQAFDEFLADGKPYFLPRTYLPLEDSVKIIEKAGGVAVAAHPLQYEFEEPKLKAFLQTVKDLGAVGMETVYSKYSKEQSEYLEKIAAELGLICTGGSDHHGRRKPDINIGTGCGEMCVPDEYLANLRAAWEGKKA